MTTGYAAKDIGDKCNCEYCGKVFYRFRRARCGRRAAALRKCNSVTCCQKCSKANAIKKAKAKKW